MGHRENLDSRHQKITRSLRTRLDPEWLEATDWVERSPRALFRGDLKEVPRGLWVEPQEYKISAVTHAAGIAEAKRYRIAERLKGVELRDAPKPKPKRKQRKHKERKPLRLIDYLANAPKPPPKPQSKPSWMASLSAFNGGAWVVTADGFEWILASETEARAYACWLMFLGVNPWFEIKSGATRYQILEGVEMSEDEQNLWLRFQERRNQELCWEPTLGAPPRGEHRCLIRQT